MHPSANGALKPRAKGKGKKCPPGPAGPAGPVGPEGPAGPAGPPGIGMNLYPASLPGASSGGKWQGAFTKSANIQNVYYSVPITSGTSEITMYVINGVIGTQGAFVEFEPLRDTTISTQLLSCGVSYAGGPVTFDLNSNAPYSIKSPRLTFSLPSGSIADKIFSATIRTISN
jgi:hypothetical protein